MFTWSHHQPFPAPFATAINLPSRERNNTHDQNSDIVHGACLMTNICKKQLSDNIAWWLVGVVGQRAVSR